MKYKLDKTNVIVATTYHRPNEYNMRFFLCWYGCSGCLDDMEIINVKTLSQNLLQLVENSDVTSTYQNIINEQWKPLKKYNLKIQQNYGNKLYLKHLFLLPIGYSVLTLLITVTFNFLIFFKKYVKYCTSHQDSNEK